VLIDRRKSDLDVIEHLVRGLRPADLRATIDDRPPAPDPGNSHE